MTAICRWPSGCTGHAGQRGFSRGFCRTHYLRLHRAGRIRPGFVDGSLVQARLAVYKSRKRSLRTAATLTGIDHRTLSDLAAGRIAKARPRVARAILTAPLPPSDIGCVRRVQALLALGHTAESIATEMGYKRGSVLAAMARQRFGDRFALALLGTYEHLSGFAGSAQRADYPTPFAWEDVDIDDPAAVSDVGPRVRISGAARIAEVEWQLAVGESLEMACKQVGIDPLSLDKARWRLSKAAEVAA
jgi:hypothetical protein